MCMQCVQNSETVYSACVIHFPEAPKKYTYPCPLLRDDAIFALLEGGFRRKRCDGSRLAAKKRWVDTPKDTRTHSLEWYFVSFHRTVREWRSPLTVCDVYQCVECQEWPRPLGFKNHARIIKLTIARQCCPKTFLSFCHWVCNALFISAV